MRFNKGDRVAHKRNPLNWRGVITWVKPSGTSVKVMLASGVEVEVPPRLLQIDFFTDEEVEILSQ